MCVLEFVNLPIWHLLADTSAILQMVVRKPMQRTLHALSFHSCSTDIGELVGSVPELRCHGKVGQCPSYGYSVGPSVYEEASLMWVHCLNVGWVYNFFLTFLLFFSCSE